jgi:hypothetical protein
MKNLLFVEDDSGKLLRVSFLSEGKSIKEVYFDNNVDINRIDYLFDGSWKTVYFNADGTYDMNKIEQMSKEFVRLHSDRYLNVYTLARELRSLFKFFSKKY